VPSIVGGTLFIKPKEDSMSKGIPLHKDRGIGPHRFKCPDCGKYTNELNIGALTVIHEHGDPSNVLGMYNTGSRSDFLKHNPKATNYPTRDAYDREVFTSDSPCDDCIKAYKEAIQKILKAGGIHFKCNSCGMQGMLKGDCELSRDARKQSGIAAPYSVGIEFDDCSQHS